MLRMLSPEKITIAINAIIALAAVMTFLAISWQLKGARQSLRLDQRAWVTVNLLPSGLPEANKPFILRLRIINTGKTFARSVKIRSIIRAFPKDQPAPDFDAIEAAEQKKGQSIALLPPNATYGSETTSGNPLASELADRVRSGETRIFVFGKVTYTDVFDYQHWTTFCSVMKTDGHYEVWKTHNDADDLPILQHASAVPDEVQPKTLRTIDRKLTMK